MESYSKKNNAIFDMDEEEKGSAWGKALGRYRIQKMDEQEIDKHRQAYQKAHGLSLVKTIASRSKGSK